MVREEQKARLGFLAFSLLFLGGCNSWFTPPPVSPTLQPLIAQASPAEDTTLPDSLVLGVAWLNPSDDAKGIPKRATQKLFHQIREHFSEPGIALRVASIDPVASVDLAALRQLGQQHGVTHMLVVAPTVQEITVPEKFGAPRGNWLGTRTESHVFLEAVGIELETGLPIFEAQGNGQASLEVLDYGSFGPFPRIFRGVYFPGDGNIYYPEGGKEDFYPGEVRAIASNYALAGLLYKLDRVKTSNHS